MSLQKRVTYTAESLVAAAYQSTTGLLCGALDVFDKPGALFVKCGDWTGTGNLKVTAAHAAESITSGFQTFLTCSPISAANGTDTAFQLDTKQSRPLLPYIELRTIIENTGGTALTVEDIVVSFLVDR